MGQDTDLGHWEWLSGRNSDVGDAAVAWVAVLRGRRAGQDQSWRPEPEGSRVRYIMARTKEVEGLSG